VFLVLQWYFRKFTVPWRPFANRIRIALLCHENVLRGRPRMRPPAFSQCNQGFCCCLDATGHRIPSSHIEKRAFAQAYGPSYTTQPRALSLTQATRLALCTPAELRSWPSLPGIQTADSMDSSVRQRRSFSGRYTKLTRGGRVCFVLAAPKRLAVGEAVFFFDRTAREFDYRSEQGVPLASKMRFLSAPWVCMLQMAWLRHAKHASKWQRLMMLCDPCRVARVSYPVESTRSCKIPEPEWRNAMKRG